LKSLAVQFVLFSSVGAVGTGGHFAVLYLLVQELSADPVKASMTGFLTGALINYWLNYHITFKSSHSHFTSLPKFLTIALAGFFLNALVMAQATEHFHYLLSQVFATSLVLVWNFLCNRFWTFRGEAHVRS